MSATVQIAPSILTIDYGRMAEQIGAAEAAGADLWHLDVMDGHFVPPITFGDNIVAAVRRLSALPIEVHMMVANPADQFGALAEAGADRLIFHLEATSDLDDARALITAARALDREVGVAISPETPAVALRPLIESIDEVVVMLIKPGWGGQQMNEELLEKVAAVRSLDDGRLRVEVDGGVKAHNAGRCIDAGADTLVAGSAVFNPDQTPAEALGELRAAIAFD